MSKPFQPKMSWDYMNEYLSKDADYKEQSRALLSEALGFEPNLSVSIVPEIQLRDSIKKFQNGDLSKATLDKHVSNLVKFIRHTIVKRHPEQAHLLDKNYP